MSTRTAAARSAILYACLLLLLVSPLGLRLASGGLADLAPFRLWMACGLTSAFILAPLLVVSSVKRAAQLHAPLAALSALYLAFALAFHQLPDAGAYYIFLTASDPHSLAEFFGDEAQFVLTACAIWAAYLACVFSGRLPDVPAPPLLRRVAAYVVAINLVLSAVAHAAYEAASMPGWRDAYPGFVGDDFAAALGAKRQAEAGFEKVRRYRGYSFGVTAAPPRTARALHIVILGESSRFDHWGVNGYHRQTSPRLARYAPDELISFTDVSAPANFTLRAVTLALTGARVRDPVIERHKSVVSIFKEAGWHTTWLSNQDATILEAMEADEQAFINTAWYRSRQLDTALLPRLDEVLRASASRGGNDLIVLHLMGSHSAYTHRYAPRHAEWGSPGLFGAFPRLPFTLQRQTMVDQYDNTVLAADEVIDEVVKRAFATGREAFVTYCSDHGENLMDDERGIHAHASRSSSVAEVHTPLFLFPSAKYRAAHPEKVAALVAHRRLKADQDDLIWWLADLAGIRHRRAGPSASIGDVRYVPPIRRWTEVPGGTVVEVESLR